MSVQERHRRERQARGQAILAAAAKVFAKHGLDGATIEMVARDAEVAVGTIYLYFASRDDLYLSLIAERAEQVRQRYLEIFARGLDPLAELKAVASTYLDYLNESRELFLSQHSVVYAQLQKRLKRPSEQRNFQRVMDLSHEVFGLWERTVRRAFEGGVIANSMGPKKTAAVIWASMNGAFMLMGDNNYFRGVTGLNPEHFLDEALESHLAASQLSAGHRNGRAARGPASKKSANAVRTSRARSSKSRDSQEVAAPPIAH
ncbi:MAG TPA: TetR/AcrR family transcriptional regulator [Candidatus Acidoferrales bacterium]|nr:TetR/AcrR family transcriptional regulator [Candidatus Acidoferrales bacterium]